jgi:hypothetical protein
MSLVFHRYLATHITNLSLNRGIAVCTVQYSTVAEKALINTAHSCTSILEWNKTRTVLYRVQYYRITALKYYSITPYSTVVAA